MSARQIASDIAGVLKGLQIITNDCIKLNEIHLKRIWANSSIKALVDDSKTKLNNKANYDEWHIQKFINETVERTSMVTEGIKAFSLYEEESQADINNVDNYLSYDEIDEVDLLKLRKIHQPLNENLSNSSVTDESKIKAETVQPNFNTEFQKNPEIPKETIKATSLFIPLGKEISENNTTKIKTVKYKQQLNEKAKESKVPSSRIGRVFSFGTLAAGLGIGTVAEMARRTFSFGDNEFAQPSSNPFLNPANAERIVNTLCKVRGAALKIGQLMSIQDSNVIDPVLQNAFERVRQSADFMPQHQIEQVLVQEFGHDWRKHFLEFDMKPFAAASIGQVHFGKLITNEMEVAVKIQYPGVAKGINSDIDNLVSVMNMWRIFPEGLFIDKIVEVAKKELSWEVDYIREADCTRKFKKLLNPYSDYYVPTVIDKMSTKQIFTSELIEGISVDKCQDLNFETRYHICSLIMRLCLMELFEFRFMQTDPNWSNFFYNQNTKKLILLDFGSSREFSKTFMDQYIRIIKAASDGYEEDVLNLSKQMGFLTGYESKAMEEAHVETIMILGEVFSEKAGEFDFEKQDTTLRVTDLVPTILNERLCPPPEEIYSLHRKLSGVFLLCSKLKVKINCRLMFLNIYDKYKFD